MQRIIQSAMEAVQEEAMPRRIAKTITNTLMTSMLVAAGYNLYEGNYLNSLVFILAGGAMFLHKNYTLMPFDTNNTATTFRDTSERQNPGIENNYSHSL